MDKYAQMKRLHHDCWLQVYMYNFMYVYTGTIPEEYHFPSTNKIVGKYKEINLQDQSQTIGLNLVKSFQKIVS